MEDISLEIGPRTFPLVEYLRKDLLPSDKIVYLEKRGVWAKELKKAASPEVIQGNGTALPLKEASVGTIFAKDLFGAHGYLSALPGAREIEQIPQGMANEWFRVCRSGGYVIIIEISTPPNKHELERNFTSAGFKKKEEHLGRNVYSVLEIGDILKHLPDSLTRDAYSLVFQKP